MFEDLLDTLRSRLAHEQRLLVAFSGGVDSALLATVAHDVLGANMLAVTAVSPSLAARERRLARQFTAERGIPHLEVRTDEAERPEYTANGADRCYHCKTALFDPLAPLNAISGATIALGTNLDDLGEHRPGQQAAQDRGAIAPLVDAGFSKAAVREASDLLGLSTADRPAAACLSSRIVYGDPVRPKVLAQVEAVENTLHTLGFPVCRVRSHSDGTVARIEVPEHDLDHALSLRAELDNAARAAGFQFCALDLAGFASGRMNTALPLMPVNAS